MAKISFKEGSNARKARGTIAERIKSGDIKGDVREPFALATHIVKGMRTSKRHAVAGRR